MVLPYNYSRPSAFTTRLRDGCPKRTAPHQAMPAKGRADKLPRSTRSSAHPPLSPSSRAVRLPGAGQSWPGQIEVTVRMEGRMSRYRESNRSVTAIRIMAPGLDDADEHEPCSTHAASGGRPICSEVGLERPERGRVPKLACFAHRPFE